MRLPWFVSARTAAALFAVVTAVSACTAVVVEEEPRPRPEPRFCTREYEPVCARRGDDRRTFANSCLADEAGYRILRDGQCRGDRDDDNGGSVCTERYDPVCASRGRDRRTFSNSCEAAVAGYEVERPGECRRRDRDDEDGSGGEFCTREYAPVCARRGRETRTFPNGCEARSADYSVIADGPCG